MLRGDMSSSGVTVTDDPLGTMLLLFIFAVVVAYSFVPESPWIVIGLGFAMMMLTLRQLQIIGALQQRSNVDSGPANSGSDTDQT